MPKEMSKATAQKLEREDIDPIDSQGLQKIPEVQDEDAEVIEAVDDPPPIEEEPAEPEEEKKEDDPRKAIADAARARRMEQMDNEFEEGSDPTVQGGRWAKPGEPTADLIHPPEDAPKIEEDPEPESTPETTPEPPADDLVEIEINGQTVRVTQDELVNLAKQGLTTGQKLDQIDQQLRADRAPETQEDPETTKEPDTQSDQLSDDDVNDIVEKIQTGDPEEAAEAVRRLASAQKQSIDIETTVQERVDEAIRAAETQRTSDAQMQKWAERNSEIIADPDAASAVTNNAVSRARQELIGIGCDPQQVAALNVDGVTSNFARLRADPKYTTRLSDPFAILDNAAEDVRTKFKLGQAEPDPQPDKEQKIPDRTERKENLQAQPRPTSGKAQTPPPEKTSTRGDLSATVAKMRTGRGQ